MWNTDLNNMIARTNGPAVTTTLDIAHSEIAKPLHLQRLESSLDMAAFMSYTHKMLSKPLTSSEESEHTNATDNDDDDDDEDDLGANCGGRRRRRRKVLGTKQERQNVKAHLYNFTDLTSDREWLYDIILSDTETEMEFSDEDDYVKEMLKTHVREQKYRETFYKVPTNTQYGYYAAGFLSIHDMFPDHQRSIVGVRKRRRGREKKEKPPKKQKMPKIQKVKKPKNLNKPEPGEINPADLKHYAWGETSAMCGGTGDDGDADGFDLKSRLPFGIVGHSGRGRKKKSLLPRTPEVMAARRRKVWQLMAKKELGKYQRAKVNNHKEILQGCKRVASMCMKVSRQRAMQSQKIMKETIWRAKRLTREMQVYWKRYDRVERETRRRMEKEAEEQRRIDVEIIEAKRQQRKLNFLITQTELYAHFMSKKLGYGTEEEQLRILNQLDEEINPRLAAYDDYDPDYMKQLAQRNAEDAFVSDRAKTTQFEVAESLNAANPAAKPDLPQPDLFRGTLKTYQLKGMTWLANLYDQGISGILADEMGLGKTVQSIAFLCHIAEKYGVWGPFLIISPASTLHNWQQEMQRFSPNFIVVPYWGSPTERRILRQFWEQKDLHTKDARFHVVITSYQLVVSDYKYFNRIKWQYMVLDEAQAIKSSSSMRWKLLLGFNCRNRLLLSGTPIQNSMAELWALLHFIMPTLFDSHDEFNEWFSKDIESHAENKTGIDEKQISRLHMILKPFMLRRIKKDVENELSDKIEIMVYCPLTIRQKLLYMALKKKIRIEDLLHYTVGGGDGHHVDRNFTSNLMNLVMQFRKVCNHPELFERRDAKSPFTMYCEEYVMPRLIYDEALLATTALPSRKHLLYNRLSIFKSEVIQRSFFHKKKKVAADYRRYIDVNANAANCAFSFTRLCDVTPKELEDITVGGLIELLNDYRRRIVFYALLAYRRQMWKGHFSPTRFMLLEPFLENALHKRFMLADSVLRNFIFTGISSLDSTVYTFGDYETFNMQETIEHRVIRSKSKRKDVASPTATISTIEDVIDLDLDKSEVKSEVDLDVSSYQEDVCRGATRGRPPKNAEKSAKSQLAASIVLLPEFPYSARPPTRYMCEALNMPRFLYGLGQKVQAVKRRFYCESRAAEWAYIRHTQCENPAGQELICSGLELCKPRYGWSSIVIPDKQTLVSDAGKLAVLDNLLTRLKAGGHRVLIYSQMTKMIDLLEEYMWHRKHRYMRLDGSSKISARRDMVADFQSRSDIFVFLLSTRAGGLGINLTAADTVIFYDSDWNPTVDQQAMDRAHRLGQTKQVTVYRLICKGTIEERILQRAREKSEIQRMVISGGNFKPDTLKPKEVVSLLLDDEEIELKYRQNTDDTSTSTSTKDSQAAGIYEKKRRQGKMPPTGTAVACSSSASSSASGQATPSGRPTTSSATATTTEKRQKLDFNNDEDSATMIDVGETNTTTSPTSASGERCASQNNNPEQTTPMVPGAMTFMRNDESSNEALIVDCDSPLRGTESPGNFNNFESLVKPRRRHHPRGTKRGRPRGSRRGGGNGTLGRPPASTRVNTPPSSSTPGPSSSGASQQPTANANDSAGGSITNMGEGVFSPVAVPPPVKRGPGRPRLKPGGPPHQGTRGTPRTRKPIGPLVVPLGQSPQATPLTRSPVISPAPSPAHSERSSSIIGHCQPNDNDN